MGCFLKNLYELKTRRSAGISQTPDVLTLPVKCSILSQPASERSCWLYGRLAPRAAPEDVGVLFVVEIRQASFPAENGMGWLGSQLGSGEEFVSAQLAYHLSPCLLHTAWALGGRHRAKSR